MKLIFFIGLFVISVNIQSLEVSSKLQVDNGFSISPSDLVQADLLFDVDFSSNIYNGEFFIKVRTLVDAKEELVTDHGTENEYFFNRSIYKGKNIKLDLREAYWQSYAGDFFLTLGKQQVVWGVSDGVKLLDVINPQSFREFILDDPEDSRIPLWMLNVEFSVSGSGILQWLWIPDPTVSQLASSGSQFELTSPVFKPIIDDFVGKVVLLKTEYPENNIREGDMGIRYMDFLGGWDLSFVYLHHYIDTPAIKSYVENEILFLQYQYQRSNLFGMTASKSFNSLTLRMELAYETDRYHRVKDIAVGVNQSDQFSFILGLDHYSKSDHYFSIQVYQSRLERHDEIFFIDKVENISTFHWKKNYFNERMKLSTVLIHSLSNGDGVLRPKVMFNSWSESNIFISYDQFYGGRGDVFGQFKKSGLISLGYVAYF